MDATGVEFFLAYGTFLGLEREGGFIAHDRDIDLGIRSEDLDAGAFGAGGAKQRIAEAFAAQGFADKGPRAAAINLVFKHETGAVVELYLHFERNGQVVSGFETGGTRLLWSFTPFELASRAWLGTRFQVPSNASRYLKEAYGDWRRPDPHFEATFWAPNVVGGFPPISRAYAYLKTFDALRAGRLDTVSAHLERIQRLDGSNPEVEALRLWIEGLG